MTLPSLRSLMWCPRCGKKGVSLRLNAGGDHYGCRYCDFFAYTGCNDDDDVKGRITLRELNLEHPLRPGLEPHEET